MLMCYECSWMVLYRPHMELTSADPNYHKLIGAAVYMWYVPMPHGPEVEYTKLLSNFDTTHAKRQ